MYTIRNMIILVTALSITTAMLEPSFARCNKSGGGGACHRRHHRGMKRVGMGQTKKFNGSAPTFSKQVNPSTTTK
jgi:hypothetical protein